MTKGAVMVIYSYLIPSPPAQMCTSWVEHHFCRMPLSSCEWSILLLLSQQRSAHCLSASNDGILQPHPGWQVSGRETELLLWAGAGGGRAKAPQGCPAVFPLSCGQMMARIGF